MTVPVDLVVNCYERTYRRVLSPGFFLRLEQQNRVHFRGRFAVINNTDSPADARELAQKLVRSGELTAFAFVSEVLPTVARQAGLGPRQLRFRPYFLDYAPVMATAGSAEWLLGWDAEVELVQSFDWVTPALELMQRRSDVFSCAPRWPKRQFDSLDSETVEAEGPWALNWGFSDQVFLVRRRDLATPIYRCFAPAAYARHAIHPWTFEARMEAYQRAHRRYRASHALVEYSHNDLPEIVQRSGGRSSKEQVQYVVLAALARALQRSPVRHPAWRI